MTSVEPQGRAYSRWYGAALVLTVVLSASAVAEGWNGSRSPWSSLDRADKFGSEAWFDLFLFLFLANLLVVAMIRPIGSPWTAAAIALCAIGLGAFRWSSLVSLADRNWTVIPTGVVGVVSLLITGLMAVVHAVFLRRARRLGGWPGSDNSNEGNHGPVGGL